MIDNKYKTAQATYIFKDGFWFLTQPSGWKINGG